MMLTSVPAAPRVLGAALFLFAASLASAQAGSEASTVFYSTDTFEVTEFDLQMYLRNRPPTPDSEYGSRASVLQALSDLYALEILSRDAKASTPLAKEELEWVARYAVKMELTRRYLKDRVDARLSATDWDSEALETYLANTDEFVIPESVTVRTLLLRTETRTEAEAIDMASELAANAESFEDFEDMVVQFTEDEASLSSNGLIKGLQRGQTVKPFETAAFALEKPGDISAPVVSRYGVHLIQLIDRVATQQRPFAEVKDEIIENLKPKRKAQYRSALQDEARERQPIGFTEHTNALDELMLRTADGPLGVGAAAE